MSGVDRRRAMFRVGAAAAEQVLPDWANQYPCPVCLVPFEETAVEGPVVELAEEHVPPESLGGRALCLTCRSCNSTAGSTIDKQMLEWHRLLTFGTPHTMGALPATTVVGGVKQRATVLYDGDVFIIRDVGKQNHPGTPGEMTAALDRLNDSTGVRGEFRLNVKPDVRLARIGWMRAAYLVVFAQFGYSAITRQCYTPLREQIQRPTADIMPTNIVIVADDMGMSAQAIVVPREPELLSNALIVVSGPYAVIVPRPEAPNDFYDRLARDLSERPAFAFSGQFYPWPQGLACSLDLGGAAVE